jgi:flavin-dependent dehydrogenase
MDLNRMLLRRAESAGAAIEKTRVMGIERSHSNWKLRTRCGAVEADYCIVATGARNPLREVGTQWGAKDTMVALGYYVTASQEHIDIQFLPQLEGYIWVFPRCGHLSVGICGKGESAQSLRARLETYMTERSISWKEGKFYSHMLPSLESPGWRSNRVSGDGWLAVGDAGGLVDPITGEGLYYAMRSGDLASRVVIDDAHSLVEKAAAYRSLLAKEFALDLEFAASIAKRVFLGDFLFSSVPARMIQFMRRSPRFRSLMQDLFAGTQPYLDLKSRLLRNLNGTLQEVLMNLFLNRVVPEKSRAIP